MILDHVANIGVPDEALRKYRNECNRLRVIRAGLDSLNAQIAGWESQVGSSVDTASVGLMCFGNDPFLTRFPIPLIECMFHWYAVSACNFVRLVGWVTNQEGASSLSPAGYVQSVLPAVGTFRDKVAAHFGRTEDRDGSADQRASVFPQVGLMNGVFKVGIMKLGVRVKGVVSTSSDMAWSITETHQALARRYWPGATKEAGD